MVQETGASPSADTENEARSGQTSGFFTGSYRAITSDALEPPEPSDETRPIKVTTKAAPAAQAGQSAASNAAAQQPRSFSSDAARARPQARSTAQAQGRTTKASISTDQTTSFVADETAKHSVAGLVTPRWRIMYNATLVVLDALMMFIATALILLIRNDVYTTVSNHIPGGVPALLAIMCGSWLVSLLVVKSYRRHIMGEGYDLYARIVLATVLEFVLLCCVAYLFHLEIPRWMTVLAPLIAFCFTCVERWLMRRSLHRNRRKGEYTYPAVIVGSPEGIRRTIATLTGSGKSIGYAPIAVCPIEAVSKESDPDAPQHLRAAQWVPQNAFESQLRVLPLNSQMPSAARKMNACAVLVTDVLARDSETMRSLSLSVESLSMEMVITVAVADIGAGRLRVRNHAAMPVLTASLSQYSLGTRFLKRTIDVVCSALALIPFGIIMGIAAIAIKIEDGGPVFYTQERIGRYGKPFKIYKMRSMVQNADKLDTQVAAAQGVDHGITFKLKDDPRVTKVGKFIRKTSIDELPQLFNVLKGDMSLVGPRPQQQYEVDQYGALYSTRLLVRPGITGPWQISGRNNLSTEEAEYLDVNYVENWSLTTDIAILMKTIMVVIKGDGAY